MVAEEKKLRNEIARIRHENPASTTASFAEISFESEVEEGASPAFAASKWFDRLTRRA